MLIYMELVVHVRLRKVHYSLLVRSETRFVTYNTCTQKYTLLFK
jgi:hypothetical protein